MTKMVLTLLFLLITNSCKYKLSTYSAETADQNLNEINLLRIQEQEVSPPGTFKVAIISDTHNYYRELEKIVDTINDRGPFSFIIVSGDITNFGLLEEFDHARKFLSKLKFPYLVAVGNHDLLANGKLIFERMFGPENFEFSFEGVQFIFLNNNNWESAGDVPDISWLEGKLSSSVSTRKIIIAHVPPDDRDRFSDQKIQDFSALLDTYNVNYVINGHNHNPEVSMFSDAVQITVGAPSKGSYFELTFSPGGIDHQQVDF